MTDSTTRAAEEAAQNAALQKAVASNPDDVAAVSSLADLDLLAGRVDAAFDRLVELVRRTSGSDRDAARAHLVELFELVGPQDERVARARTALANALF